VVNTAEATRGGSFTAALGTAVEAARLDPSANDENSGGGGGSNGGRARQWWNSNAPSAASGRIAANAGIVTLGGGRGAERATTRPATRAAPARRRHRDRSG
jgi:hypothetical protein